MSYKLLEFGGKANVILRANIEMNINNTIYKPNDVVFLFEDVDLSFTYNEKNIDKKIGGRNEMTFFERNINSINISDLSLTSNYIEVFGSFYGDSFERSVIEKTSIQNNKWYSLHTPSTDEVVVLNEGIYKISNNEEYNEVSLLDSSLEDGDYTIIYKTKVLNSAYDINSMCSIPYMSMEIVGVGNVDKEDGNVYIYIPKVSLINRPDFSLTDTITAQDLTFRVVQDKIIMGVY